MLTYSADEGTAHLKAAYKLIRAKARFIPGPWRYSWDRQRLLRVGTRGADPDWGATYSSLKMSAKRNSRQTDDN